ncbi:MAG: polyprenyl diphosphate synthase [Planctomycetota bacterium]
MADAMDSQGVPEGATDYRGDPAALEAAQRLKARGGDVDPLGVLPDVHPDRIPRHIAFIMDGNGRWANERGFPRSFGHRNGARAVREMITSCVRLGIEQITLYSFSTENWSRPEDEVNALMELCGAYIEGNHELLRGHGVRFRSIGRRAGLPAELTRSIEHLEDVTSDCNTMTLCVALNYGSRDEIVDAARAIAEQVKSGDLEPGAINTDVISEHLYTAGMPEPDLLVRTAGEMRVSNYLLWQISYAELYVTETLWPDFDEGCLHDAVRAFASRKRRFGGLDSPEHADDAGG